MTGETLEDKAAIFSTQGWGGIGGTAEPLPPDAGGGPGCRSCLPGRAAAHQSHALLGHHVRELPWSFMQ